MTKAYSPVTTAAPRRFLPALLLLFAGSGCSALIYEIVWYQLLQLVIGSTAVSLGVLLATFMGGLCLGSVLLAALPAGVGILCGCTPAWSWASRACGILALIGMPLVSGIYVAAVGHGLPSILLRAVICAICLLPPTMLMGASLPAAARWLETSPEGVSWMGLLYGATPPARCSAACWPGFYLLRVSDMATATFVAAAINVAVALVSLALARRSPHTAAGGSAAQGGTRPGYWPVYAAIALSGASALGAEVVWTRLLGLMLGATVYTFSIILAVFLVGLGIGSAAGVAICARRRGRASPWAAARWRWPAAVAWTAWHAFRFPAVLAHQSVPFHQPLVHLPAGYGALPVGHSARGAALGRELSLGPGGGGRARRRSGAAGGRVYAANTGGAILGALAFSMILIPWIGTRYRESVLIGIWRP